MVQKIKLIPILFLFLLLVLPLVSGAPPQTNVNLDIGYSISYPKFEVVSLNEEFNLSVHVYNVSDGLPVTTATCKLEIYNQNGQHIVDGQNLVLTDDEYNYYMTAGNFSINGLYHFNIACNTTNYGGFVDGLFEVTPKGKEFTTASSIMYSTFLFLLVIIILIGAYVITLLPKANTKDDEGSLIRISWLKYLRGSMWFVEYILFVLILFIVSTLALNFLPEMFFGNMFFTLYQIAFRLAPLIIIVWILWMFNKIFQDKELWGMMKRGIFKTGDL